MIPDPSAGSPSRPPTPPQRALGLRRLGAAALAVTAALGVGTVAPAHADPTGPCGALAASYDPASPPTYQHVVVIMDENTSPAALTSTSAPYVAGLMAACGSESDMHAATHPSQPNYMAATSGTPSAVGTRSPAENVFDQLAGNWRSYEESMPANCAGSSGFYQKGHNPAFWSTDLRSPVNLCATNDVPLTAFDPTNLPAFSWVTPNQCDDMHYQSGCPGTSATRVTTGDTWLSTFLPPILSSPDFQAGNTLVLLTWDEGQGTGKSGEDCTDPNVYLYDRSCDIPTVVLSAYLVPGTKDTSDQSLYTLLGTVQDILAVPRINGSATHPASLRPGLGF